MKTAGLAGIIAGDSEICLVEPEHESLLYRGYDVKDLAYQTTFEECAYLILKGKLPNEKELKEYCETLKELRSLPQLLLDVLQKIPSDTNMMDILRTGVSFLGTIEPENEEHTQDKIADRLLACLPSMLLAWFIPKLPLQTDADSQASFFLHTLHGTKPAPGFRRALDLSLILYAEHEFNASTFTVRTIASTLPDFYSPICGGIGALRGSLHGGANEAALDLILTFSTPDNAEKGILQMLANKELIMGFGHRVYTTKDPRSPIIKEVAQTLCEVAGNQTLFHIAERIEQVMWREKKLFPNLDFYSALVFYSLDIPKDMFTPLFVFSRITGWCAHLMEQRAHNKLIRPSSNYTGPAPKKFIPIQERA